MNILEEKSLCCGCSACVNACPQKAIKLYADNEGFLYPQTDENLCANCGICKKVCPLQGNVLEMRKTFLAYAAKHKNPDVLAASSSGGVFTAISDYILEQGGVVYGAAFSDSFRVCHQRATTPEQRNAFRGSKYVQSDLGNSFQLIAKDLHDGLLVLFSGTPCQNAGLLNYLDQAHIDTTNLYLLDFICHGTSSPLIWKEYVDFLESRYQQKLKAFTFRSKANGWKNSQLSAHFTDCTHDNDCNKKYSYLNLYKSLYLTQPACFHCKFTSYNRPSDITLADFWNVGKSKPHMDDDKGVSTVLINSEKGQKLFNAIKDEIVYEESTPEECWQPHLEYPCAQPKRRNKFWQEYYRKGAAFIIKKYGKGTISGRLIKMLTPLIKKTGLYKVAGRTYGILFGGNKIVNTTDV